VLEAIAQQLRSAAVLETETLATHLSQVAAPAGFDTWLQSGHVEEGDRGYQQPPGPYRTGSPQLETGGGDAGGLPARTGVHPGNAPQR
jgi:hypothetical protein